MKTLKLLLARYEMFIIVWQKGKVIHMVMDFHVKEYADILEVSHVTFGK